MNERRWRRCTSFPERRSVGNVPGLARRARRGYVTPEKTSQETDDFRVFELGRGVGINVFFEAERCLDTGTVNAELTTRWSEGWGRRAVPLGSPVEPTRSPTRAHHRRRPRIAPVRTYRGVRGRSRATLARRLTPFEPNNTRPGRERAHSPAQHRPKPVDCPNQALDAAWPGS